MGVFFIFILERAAVPIHTIIYCWWLFLVSVFLFKLGTPLQEETIFFSFVCQLLLDNYRILYTQITDSAAFRSGLSLDLLWTWWKEASLLVWLPECFDDCSWRWYTGWLLIWNPTGNQFRTCCNTLFCLILALLYSCIQWLIMLQSILYRFGMQKLLLPVAHLDGL